jgi:hypothetical protein
MTIKEFKNTMQFNLRDTFTYIRDNENVKPKMNDEILKISAMGDFYGGGFINYVIKLA